MQLDKYDSNDRTIAIVRGYDFSPPPEMAVRLGLNERFAVAFDTYRNAKASMYFDAELFYSILGVICASLECDRLVVSDSSGTVLFDDTAENAISAIAQANCRLKEEDRMPSAYMSLYRCGKVVGVALSESWLLGGEYPYCDSFVLNVFTDDGMYMLLLNACAAECRTKHAAIRCVMTGLRRYSDRDKQVDWPHRLLAWLRKCLS